MDLIWEKFTELLKELLVGGIMDNLTGLFDNVNAKVAEAAGHIGSTPQAWNASIYSMIRSLSDNLILPIAGVILAFVMTLELIQLIADRNNLHDIDTWVFFRWVFKTAAAVLIVSNTWNIVMGVFEAAQSVVNRASGLIVGNTSINLADHIVFFFVTDTYGAEHKKELTVSCMDFEAPRLRAGVSGTLLRVEAADTLSGIALIIGIYSVSMTTTAWRPRSARISED